MRFHTERSSRLPLLGWVARIDLRQKTVDVVHGSMVEVGDQWLVEGLWAAPFDEGEFHCSRSFFGSGLRVDHDSITLVPSRATVDRIFVARSEEEVWASNSLPGLLAAMGVEPDDEWDPLSLAWSITGGIGEDTRIHLRDPNVFLRQHIFLPLTIWPDGSQRTAKPPEPRRFESFGDYHRAVASELAALRDNATSSSRERVLLAFSTVSSGYDSNTATALALEAGWNVRAAFTVGASNSMIPAWIGEWGSDDGSAIADCLGVDSIVLDGPGEGIDDWEAPMLAGGAEVDEIAFCAMLEEIAPPAVLFTGYHGDLVWNRKIPEAYRSPDLRRGDTSGLALSEARLHAGFVNLPVSYLFARSVRDLHRIANSSDMDAWHVGGEYDRPIPRRILETHGVPREAFGQQKKAIVRRRFLPVSKVNRNAFLAHAATRVGWSRSRIKAKAVVDSVLYNCASMAQIVLRPIRGRRGIPQNFLWSQKLDLKRELHRWAIGTVSDRMKGAVGRRHASS